MADQEILDGDKETETPVEDGQVVAPTDDAIEAEDETTQAGTEFPAM